MTKPFDGGDFQRYQAAVLRLVMENKKRGGTAAKVSARAPAAHDPEVSRAEALAQAKSLGLELEEPAKVGARGTKKMRSPVA